MNIQPYLKIVPAVAILALGASAARAEAISGAAISSLPYAISVAGRYHLTSSQTYAGLGPAITVNVGTNDVILDFNDCFIANASPVPTRTCIKATLTGTGRLTVRNGQLRGFTVGIDITGKNFLVQDMTIRGSFENGIKITNGDNGEIRNNRLVGIVTSSGSNIYINSGANMRIIGNSLIGSAITDGAGIWLVGNSQGSIIENNQISNVNFAIYQSGPDSPNMLVKGNSITTAYYGLYFNDSSIRYKGNIVNGATVPYTGGTDAGDNN
jgi:hypothetical protein